MEEFFDLGGSTGSVELYVASDITGLSMEELRSQTGYFTVPYEEYIADQYFNWD